MFCTTECWSCEDKSCKNYIDKTELYFENQKLKEKNEKLETNWNELKKYIDNNKMVLNNPQILQYYLIQNEIFEGSEKYE